MSTTKVHRQQKKKKIDRLKLFLRETRNQSRGFNWILKGKKIQLGTKIF